MELIPTNMWDLTVRDIANLNVIVEYRDKYYRLLHMPRCQLTDTTMVLEPTEKGIPRLEVGFTHMGFHGRRFDSSPPTFIATKESPLYMDAEALVEKEHKEMVRRSLGKLGPTMDMSKVKNADHQVTKAMASRQNYFCVKCQRNHMCIGRRHLVENTENE